MRSVPLRAVLESIAGYDGDDVDLLAALVRVLRPTRAQRARGEVPAIAALINLLRHQDDLRDGLAAYLRRLLHAKNMTRTFADAGMPSGSFWHELRERLTYKLLPYQPGEDSMDHVLINAFYQEGDADWMDDVPMDQAMELAGLLGVGHDTAPRQEDPVLNDALFAAKVLGLRIAGHAFDAEVLRMVPEHAHFESPFVLLEDRLDGYLDGVRLGTVSRSADEPLLRETLELVSRCHALIAEAYANAAEFGITFRVNQQLLLMERMLQRLERVLLFVAPRDADRRREAVDLTRELVRISSGRNHVGAFIERSTQAVALEVTQHTGRKGEHYITSSRSEYQALLVSALGGGAIVAVACMLKAWYGSFQGSLFFHAVLYSMNYAMAFIAIYLLHLTLATKQPAMTAATIASALDAGRKEGASQRYEVLAGLIARVWRSQFIAFVGNVFMAFPVAVLLGLAWNLSVGHELLAHKSDALLQELDPLTSLAIPHAAIAGVFLFLSGLIAGSVTNASIHRHVPLRIREHPLLKITLSERWRTRIARWYEQHAGGVISNFWFGVFMGSVGAVGAFLGLSLDIRHITFAAGNMALGLVGADWQVTAYTVFASILGIGLIGLFNFTISFGLSLTLAMRSRGVPVAEILPMLNAVRSRFQDDPRSFFLPPATPGRTEPVTGE
ncbi:MAG: recombinase [Flavobacteriales bacterium]|nr:recombinase [Flavobacteriales bacterium]